MISQSNTQVLPPVLPIPPESITQVIPPVIPAPVSSGDEAAQMPSSSGPIPGSIGTTQAEVIPVIPDAGNTQVNPVIQGNLAGLPPIEPEGNTEGTVSKSYKIPVWVIPTMERVITEINKVLPFGTPPVSMHSYGVDTLTRHEEFRKAAQQSHYFKECYGVASAQLQQAQRELAELNANLANQPVPTGQQSVLPQVTPPVIPPAEQSWRVRYEQVNSELQKALEAHALEKRAAQPVYALVKVLPDLLEQLYQEASSDSWRTPQYYQQFFQELLAPYLDSE
ncbi:hypothetical protein GO755_22630 [Spirosoma sp. HMF4905]|uniref:Uncharacterized protein n=1 Tax=Spirosoma arboris TaxID=2682092 RepID=A0A7K1SGH9_9BACT|nr:hypothetical protein [Spirosoma arboris]MVM32853.1 hypothetical protein [Spirosoma arboris]